MLIMWPTRWMTDQFRTMNCHVVQFSPISFVHTPFGRNISLRVHFCSANLCNIIFPVRFKATGKSVNSSMHSESMHLVDSIVFSFTYRPFWYLGNWLQHPLNERLGRFQSQPGRYLQFIFFPCVRHNVLPSQVSILNQSSDQKVWVGRLDWPRPRPLYQISRKSIQW